MIQGSLGTAAVINPWDVPPTGLQGGPAVTPQYLNVAQLTQPSAPVAEAAAPAYVDPYSQWGGQAAYDRLMSGFDTQKQNIFGTAGEAAANYGRGLGANILDFIDSLRLNQQQVNNKAVNADLAKRQGMQGIAGMVGRGIRSAGTVLANRNATDSSATGDIAQAYSDIGRREASQVGNEYGLAQNDVNQAQDQLNTQTAAGVRRFGVDKDQAINNIVLEARQKFADLDAAMANASLPQRINIEAEKESVRQNALSQLQQYDQQLSSGVSGIAPTSPEQRQAEAARLAGLGTPAETPFNFTSEVPAQFQGTGPFASDLPLFTLPRKRTA